MSETREPREPRETRKNILVTGGCGFIGSYFIRHILRAYPQYYVVNLDAMYYCASTDNVVLSPDERRRYKFIQGNINDYSLVRYILTEENITHIVHYAAQSHVDSSFKNSIHYTDDNVRGTHTLLECVREVNPDILFLHFSTDEVYGESQLTEAPKHEMSLLCPTNPYAASKAAAEMIVNAYIHSYKIKAIITRCNNVYGVNQYPEKLIPKFVSLLSAGKRCTIHGDGSALRSFIHVDDVSTAVDVILHRGALSEIYNIGCDPGNEISVLDFTKRLVGYFHGEKNPLDYIDFVEDRPFNDKRYFITNDKLKTLGWRQTKTLQSGLEEVIRGILTKVKPITQVSLSKRSADDDDDDDAAAHGYSGNNEFEIYQDSGGLSPGMF